MRSSREGAGARQNPGVMRHGESGQTTVVMALFMATFLFGFIAVGIDVQALFHAKRQAQAAADAAAIAAAEESPQGIASEVMAAKAAAKLNGFDAGLAVNPAVVTVNQVPSGGNYSGATSGAFLEVVVSQPIKTFFAGIVTHKNTMVVAARAVAAREQESPTCVCLEGTTGTDLDLSGGGTKYSPNGCGTTVDSTDWNAVKDEGGPVLGGVSLGLVSILWDRNNLQSVGNGSSIASGTKVVQGVPACNPPPPKPLPTFNPALCTQDPAIVKYTGGSSVYDVGPGADPTYTKTQNGGGLACYNSLLIGANSNVITMKDGIYVINGGTLEFKSGTSQYGSNRGGSSVVFYLTGNANLIIGNDANVNLIAPLTGPYAGILIIQDPGDTSVPRAADKKPMAIGGGATTSFSGEIYAPTSDLTLNNGSGTSINADIVANTLTMGGGGTLNSTPKSNLGTFNISTAKLTE